MVTGLILALALAAGNTAARPAPSLRDTVEMAILSGVSVSPDGRYAVWRQEKASIADNRRRLSWWAAPVDGATPARKIADGGPPIWTDAGPAGAETPQWSADGPWFYFRAVGDDGLQLWRANPETNRVEQVTHDPADIEAYSVANGGVTWRVGPTRDEVMRAERDEYDNGVRIDGSVDPAQNLFDAVDINGRFASQRLSGLWFARRSILTSAPARFYRSDLDGRDVSALGLAAAQNLGLSEMEGPRPLFAGPADLNAVSRYGRLSIVRSRDSGAKVEVRRSPDAAAVACPDVLCKDRVVAGRWLPEKDVVILSRVEPGHRQSLVAWDLGRQKVWKFAGGDGLLNGGLSETAPCAFTQHRAICVAVTPREPARVVSISLDDSRITVIADPNAALSLGGGAPERLTWRDSEGRAFTGVFFPATAPGLGQRPPLFLTYYTCEGFVVGGTGDEWPMRSLAESGVASLCINKTEAPAVQQDSVANYHVALSGIRAIVDELDRSGRIDRTRIGMGGLSFGSEVTMWVATESDLLTAASISTPQLEPAYYWIHGVAGRDNHGPMKIAWGLGAPEETPDRWRQVSPALKAKRVRAALLMQMAEQEYRVGPELLARLSNSATPVEAYVFSQEPHVKIQPRHKLAVYQRNLDWFRFWLQGYEDLDPGKAAQYARWRLMKAKIGRPS